MFQLQAFSICVEPDHRIMIFLVRTGFFRVGAFGAFRQSLATTQAECLVWTGLNESVYKVQQT